MPFKERSKYPTATKKYSKNQEVNAIVQSAADDIILEYDENKKLIAEGEPQ